jgi:hypothetical protein
MVTLEIKIKFIGIPDEPGLRTPPNNPPLVWVNDIPLPPPQTYNPAFYPPVIPDSNPSWTEVTTGTIPQPITVEDGDTVQVTYTVTTRED